MDFVPSSRSSRNQPGLASMDWWILCATRLPERREYTGELGSAPSRRSAEQNPLISSHSQEHTPHKTTRYKGYAREKSAITRFVMCDVCCVTCVILYVFVLRCM